MGGAVSSSVHMLVAAAAAAPSSSPSSTPSTAGSDANNASDNDMNSPEASTGYIDLNTITAMTSKLPTSSDAIILAVDGSKEAERAFQWYVRHIHRPEHKVIVLHCHEVEHPSGKHYPDYAVPPEELANKVDQAERRGLNILEKYRTKLDEANISGEVCGQWGRPGPSVVESARRLQASMIIVGSRGMGLMRRTVLGSVSQYVVQHSPVPVTVVPGRVPTLWWF